LNPDDGPVEIRDFIRGNRVLAVTQADRVEDIHVQNEIGASIGR